MDFNDTPKEAEFRAEVRAWIAANAPTGMREFSDEPGYVKASQRWQKIKYDAGWACLNWPKEYGGRGATPIERMIFGQEEGDLNALSGIFIIGIGMAGPTIMRHGTEEQKRRYLPPMASGEEIWCQLFSEPVAGSDLAGIRTRAERDGDHWVVNGQKVWTSGAQYSDFAILVCRTDPTVPKHKGLSFFIVDMKTPGIEVRPIKQVSGESHFNEVYLTDVRIPDANRLGEVGEGWQVSMTTLMNERFAVGAAFDMHAEDLVELCRNLETEDGPAIWDKSVRGRIADWYVRSSGLKNTGLRTVTALSQGRMPGPELSIGKVVLASNRQDLASFALDLMDRAGAVTDPARTEAGALFHRAFFRSIGNRLEGGTDEILRNIIAERVLGLPQDVRVDKDVPFNQIPAGRA